jgi:DNA-3-methyladenine glycosylase I
VPVHDDRVPLEFLSLEGAQAGLSWETILKKRHHYRAAFDNFDPHAVAAYGRRTVDELLANPGIIRNRLKRTSAIRNARAFLTVQRDFGRFDAYIWPSVDGRSHKNAWRTVQEIPAPPPESDALSKDLKGRGFPCIGSTLCYAVMQAVGMVNDHLVDCFRYAEIG